MKTFRTDMHTHSVFSDGFYTPDELCRRAKENGVELLSVTDHDTLNGEAEKRAAADKYELKYLSGWEISAYAGTSKIHITGYNCTGRDAYAEFLEARRLASFKRAQDSLDKLKRLGIAVALDDVLARRADPSSPVHTMHIAGAAAEVLHMSAGEVYEKYLSPEMPAHSSIGRPTPEEAIDCIHAAGGFASIAHPGRMTMSFSAREEKIKALFRYGADGIEAFYTTHTKAETEYFTALAERAGVPVTGGSDTHIEDGTHKIGIPEFYPSEALLKRLGF